MQELNPETYPQPLNEEEKNGGSIEDPNWPSWLLEEYGALPLPSLFDFILSQEKLAAEIRKQNRELRTNSELIKDFSSQLVDVIQALQPTEVEDEEYEEEDESVEEDIVEEDECDDHTTLYAKESQQLLMQSMDAIFNLLRGMETSQKKLLTTIPEKVGFLRKSKPEWRYVLEDSLEGYVQGIDAVRKKLICYMADAGMEMINPYQGERFDPTLFRAVETIQGGKSGCIAHVVRYGYIIQDQLVRFADVTVYK